MENPLETDFNVGDEVVCKHGEGTVTYYEDGFLEVTLKENGFEKNYWAPFDGKVWPKPKVKKLRKLEDSQLIMENNFWNEYFAKDTSDNFKALLNMAEIYAEGPIMLVNMLKGGRAAPWSDLSPRQKMNFASIAIGVPYQFLLEAALSDRLDEILEIKPPSSPKKS